MAFPGFYARIPRIRLRDPLSGLFGATDDGWLDYGFDDAVRLAGHACPTVAAAYALTVKGIEALFPGGEAERGAMRARFPTPCDAGTTGVVASIVTLLTGAAGDGGFKGLAGQHSRFGRLAFAAGSADRIAFTLQRDQGATVALAAWLERVPADPEASELLPRCLTGRATAAERNRFGALWQDRLRRLLLDHWDDPALWQVQPA